MIPKKYTRAACTYDSPPNPNAKIQRSTAESRPIRSEPRFQMQLTNEQQLAIKSGKAVETTMDGVDCVLLRKDVYDRVMHLLYDDSETTHDEMLALLAQSSGANGWDEPGMEDYDRYDEIKNAEK